MDRAKTDELKQAIVNRARELGMDPTRRHTCSPGIKALAQMHEVLVLQPHLLQTFAGDLLVHDFGLLSSPHAPSRFVWTIRPSGTNLFYPEPGSETQFLFHMQTEPGSVALHIRLGKPRTGTQPRPRRPLSDRCQNFLAA